MPQSPGESRGIVSGGNSWHGPLWQTRNRLSAARMGRICRVFVHQKQGDIAMTDLIAITYKNQPDLLNQIKEAIAKGTDLNTLTQYGESSLRIASNNGRFDVVKALLDAGADAGQLEWGKSMYEVVYGTPESLEKSIATYGDLEACDVWQRTPFLLAVQLGDINKVELLLKLGADRDARGRCGKTPLQYAVQQGHVHMLQWLLTHGFDIEASDDFLQTPLIYAAELGRVDCLAFLIEAGADLFKSNDIQEQAIAVTGSLEVVRLLVSHGADINDINSETHADLLGIGFQADPQATLEDYVNRRSHRFGHHNPERVNDPFWLAMIRSGATAYQAEKKYQQSSGLDHHPVWSYDRFGRSTTLLDDGRIIEIGGEHEDSYDSNFCIYNDVTVFNTDGSIDIYTYPTGVFPPTDFHTASLIGDSILIIGCLGGPHQRRSGTTPVYRLDLKTFEIHAVETTGAAPGCIQRHKAKMDESGRIVISGGVIEQGWNEVAKENIDTWALDPVSGHWERLSDRAWPQWAFRRADHKSNHLWRMRQALWSRDHQRDADFQAELDRLRKSLGHEPDLDLLMSLYEVAGVTTATANLKVKSARNLQIIDVDGVTIKLRETIWLVEVTVEGDLAEDRIKALQDGVLANLARLEGVAWQVM